MIEKILGLDIGIASVGWAVVDYDSENKENNKIVESGVRIFTQAENPKTGDSLALPRRLARGARRTLRRKSKRMRDIKLLCQKHLDIPYNRLFGENETIYHDKGRKEIWQLRDEVLKRTLHDDEFARVLTHIAKRRGYKSNRKSEEKKDSEGKKVLGAISENEKLLQKYETIGQAIYQTTKEGEKRRNRDGDFKFSVSREMLLDEVKVIFEKQRFYQNDKATKAFEDTYTEIFLRQLDFASVSHMVGKCTFEKREKRAPKQSYSAEEFVTLTEIINNKMINNDGKEIGFDTQQIERILTLCRQSKTVTFKKIRHLLDIETSTLFKRVAYHDKNGEFLTPEDAEKKQKLKNAFEKGYHAIKKVVETSLSKSHWGDISQDRMMLNKIAEIFAHHKSDDKIKAYLIELFEKIDYLSADEKAIMIDALIENISFDTFIHLSIKAVDNIIPHMKQGLTYDKACLSAGYENKSGKKEKYLRALNPDENNELTNPVVKRAVAQTRKIINALISKHGQLDKIHIELTRDIKKSHQDRKKMQKGQNEYREEKEKVVAKFVERYGREPKGNELLKFRLFEEQDGYCFYHDKHIDITRLLEKGYVEIDHILPFSRSLDDSISNKILCFLQENQNKKNQTPYEYFTKMGKDWHRYEEIVKGAVRLRYSKKKKLLKKNFDENSSNEFRERNKNDTSFMSKFIKNFIENNLELRAKKQKVFTRNGSLTSLLRHNWGIGEKNRDNHYHHAQDAIVLAFTTQSEVQKLSTISAKHEGFVYEKKEEKSKKVRFEPPMENFRQKVEESIEDIFVSYVPRKKITGAAHKETIYPKDSKKGAFPVNGGLAENGEVKRIDVFKKDGKYHFIYLYPADFEKKKLPNTTIKGKVIDESYHFQFSIFKNELLELTNKNGTYFGYFKSGESDGRFTIQRHFMSNSDRKIDRFSTGSLIALKKYHVSPLGAYTEIKNEKRLGTKRSK